MFLQSLWSQNQSPPERYHAVLNLQFVFHFFLLSLLGYFFISVTIQIFFHLVPRRHSFFRNFQYVIFNWDTTHFDTFLQFWIIRLDKIFLCLYRLFCIWFPQKMTSMKPLMGSFFIANLYPYITLIWWIVLWTYVLPLSFTCVFLDHLSSLGKKDLKFAWFIFNLIMCSFIDSPKWDCDAFQRNNMCLFHH